VVPCASASSERERRRLGYAACESEYIAGTQMIFTVALALAGAVVGAVHGLALVR
jgi:hypothetical protein